jgi:DNA-binding HxlR family transcriptional regulator
VSTDEVLSLLDAAYTLSILESIRAEPKPARAIASECDASRPTVYRRLNALEAAGLVETDMAYDGDGHHRTVFAATLESLSVAVEPDGVTVAVATDGADRTATTRAAGD